MDLLRRLGRDIVQDAKFFWSWIRRKGIRSKLELVGWMISHGIWAGALRFMRHGFKGIAWHLRIRELEREFYDEYDFYEFTRRFVGGMHYLGGLSCEGTATEYEAEKAAQIQYSKGKVDAIKIKLDEVRRNHP